MPIYQFDCEVCEKSVDEIVPVGTKEIVCPKCGGKALKQKITSHGGYFIGGQNGASVKPSHSGSFRRKK